MGKSLLESVKEEKDLEKIIGSVEDLQASNFGNQEFEPRHGAMAGVPQSSNDCTICGRTFNRTEHLKRHLATHSSEKNLQCEVCGKGFNRRDALHRHEQTHSTNKQRSRKFRACSNCAIARVKCVGTAPCARCIRKSVTCVFPNQQQEDDGSKSPPETSSSGQGDSRSVHEPLSAVSASTNDGSWPIPSNSAMATASQAVPANLLEVEGSASSGSLANGPRSRQLVNPPWPFIPETGIMQPQAQPQQVIPNPGGLEPQGLPNQPAAQAFNSTQDDDLFRLRQDTGYALDPTALGTNVMSSFNWLSPTFDFGMEDLQFTSPQIPFSAAPDPINYQASQVPAAGVVPTQWHDTSSAIPQNHETPSLSDSSYNVHSVEGPDSPQGRSLNADGTYYVDGTGARQPRNGRYAKSVSHRTDSPQVSSPQLLIGYMFSEQEILHDGPMPEAQAPTIHITPNAYEAMVAAFQELCVLPSAMFEVYASSFFPPPSMFEKFASAYLNYFHPILPFLHMPTLDLSKQPWIFLLALSAIGSQYVSPCGIRTVTAMHEFLRRAILKHTEEMVVDQDIIAQVTLLNCIGMMYTGSTQLEKYRPVTFDRLINYFQHKFSDYSTQGGNLPASQHQQTSNWETWVQGESTRRLGHCIWLLDCMSKYHFRTRTRLLLDFSDIPLPCKELTWNAPSSNEWVKVYDGQTAPLARAMRVLYMEKRLLAGIGDFARVILIHSLFCQTWEISNSLARPLLRWTPTAQKEDSDNPGLTDDIWLPKVPTYARWRNSACDCLDVLHWIANSDIAKSGTENTTVFHLHFARIVLLTPYESIVSLVELFNQGITHQRSSLIEQHRQLICRWILEDQYKARLSLIHAGVLFWHARRYSTDAFYESTDVYMATLVLWAYGTFCPQPEQTSSKEKEDDSTSDSASISSIRLDRPTDDELVQLFVKKGRSMKATITGVGNIMGPRGPIRMLREGCKLLSTLERWSLRDRYIGTLTSLVATYDKPSG